MHGQITVPVPTSVLICATGLHREELPGIELTVTADLTAATERRPPEPPQPPARPAALIGRARHPGEGSGATSQPPPSSRGGSLSAARRSVKPCPSSMTSARTTCGVSHTRSWTAPSP